MPNNTLNGRFTKEQQAYWRLKVWKYIKGIYLRQRRKKNGDRSNYGIQLSYGQLSRRFGLTYDQAREIIRYFVHSGYLRVWNAPIRGIDRYKTKGNFYQYHYFQ